MEVNITLMIRLILFIGLIIFFGSSCQQSSVSTMTVEEENSLRDSLKDVLHARIDSITKNTLLDTIGLANAPVKVLYTGFYGRNGRSVELKWKNISSKKIAAIRFKWYGENAFNEPADMGIPAYGKGFGGGFTDDELSPGKTDSGTWPVYSRDGKKIIIAWPYEVAFSDGSHWKLKQ